VLWRYGAGIGALLIGASAFASWINEALSAEEAHQIKRFAVVSGLEVSRTARLLAV